MCRLLALIADPRDDAVLFEKLVDALIESSRHDVLLEKLTNGLRKSHGDGWGVAGIGVAGNVLALLYHRDILPIYDERSRHVVKLFIERAERYDQIYLLLHARASSRREPYGEKFVHPFIVEKPGFTILFMHNGGVDKYALAHKVNLLPWIHSDSEILSYYIAEQLDKCIDGIDDVDNCVVNVYSKIYKYTSKGSALNTGLIILYRDQLFMYFSYYAEGSLDESRHRYYQIYSLEKKHVKALFSSTLKHYLNEEAQLVKQGLYKVSLEKINKIYEFH